MTELSDNDDENVSSYEKRRLKPEHHARGICNRKTVSSKVLTLAVVGVILDPSFLIQSKCQLFSTPVLTYFVILSCAKSSDALPGGHEAPDRGLPDRRRTDLELDADRAERQPNLEPVRALADIIQGYHRRADDSECALSFKSRSVSITKFLLIARYREKR